MLKCVTDNCTFLDSFSKQIPILLLIISQIKERRPDISHTSTGNKI